MINWAEIADQNTKVADVLETKLEVANAELATLRGEKRRLEDGINDAMNAERATEQEKQQAEAWLAVVVEAAAELVTVLEGETQRPDDGDPLLCWCGNPQTAAGSGVIHEPGCLEKIGAVDAVRRALTPDSPAIQRVRENAALRKRIEAERDYMVEQGEKGHGTCRIIGEYLTALLNGGEKEA